MADGDFLGMLLRLAVSLAAVVLLMVGCGRLVARSSARRGGRTETLQVVARQSLGRRSSVVVLTVGGRGLVLGVSEQSVRLLTELDDVPGPPVVPVPQASSWRAVVPAGRRRPGSAHRTTGPARALPRTRAEVVELLRASTARRGRA